MHAMGDTNVVSLIFSHVLLILLVVVVVVVVEFAAVFVFVFVVFVVLVEFVTVFVDVFDLHHCCCLLSPWLNSQLFLLLL